MSQIGLKHNMCVCLQYVRISIRVIFFFFLEPIAFPTILPPLVGQPKYRGSQFCMRHCGKPLNFICIFQKFVEINNKTWPGKYFGQKSIEYFMSIYKPFLLEYANIYSWNILLWNFQNRPRRNNIRICLF